MTMRTLLIAKHHDAPISPAARLTLLGIADYCHDDGILNRSLTPEDVADWTHLDCDDAAAAWAELVDAGLLHVETSVPALDGTMWLTIVPGWDESWADLLWATCGVSRPAIPHALRQAVMERDHRTCQMCGSTNRPAIDHVHPVSRGGLTVLHNLRVLCHDCNTRKGARIEVAR